MQDGAQLRPTEAYATDASQDQIAVTRRCRLVGEQACINGQWEPFPGDAGQATCICRVALRFRNNAMRLFLLLNLAVCIMDYGLVLLQPVVRRQDAEGAFVASVLRIVLVGLQTLAIISGAYVKITIETNVINCCAAIV